VALSGAARRIAFRIATHCSSAARLARQLCLGDEHPG
jgi:hypothetical protein